MNDLKTLFSDLAKSTWERINLSWKYDISQGEETITDLLQLEIARLGAPYIQVIKTTKQFESKTGVDWEWWIGNDSFGWVRFVVQAKKIDANGDYKSLTRKVRSRGKNQGYQHELLMRYGNTSNAIPLYCFFNHLDPSLIRKNDHWHCKDFYQPEQLGCSLVSGQEIVDTIDIRGCRTFDFIHQKESAHPWRCLFCRKCNYLSSLLMFSGYSANKPYKLFKSLPSALQNARDNEVNLNVRDLIDFSPYEEERIKNVDDVPMPLPRRVMVFEIDLPNFSDGNGIWI